MKENMATDLEYKEEGLRDHVQVFGLGNWENGDDIHWEGGPEME